MSTQPALPFVSSYDVSRGRENESSKLANPSDEAKAFWQQKVLDVIAAKGIVGSYLKEIARSLGKQNNEVSPRITELRGLGCIRKNGEKKEGCAVYVAGGCQ